jgi:hypothetical protein
VQLLGGRLELQGPQWGEDPGEEGTWWQKWWQRTWRGHGCDEYGNCSLYVITALLGGFTIYPYPHFQREVLMPLPGENAWADRVYWKEVIEADVLTPEERDRLR